MAARLPAARDRRDAAAGTAVAAGKKKAEATALLRQSMGQLNKFSQVEVGVPCSRCGQIVDPAHAERERNELADTIRDLEQQVSDAGRAETAAEAVRAAAEGELRALETNTRQRDGLAARRAAQ